MIFVAVPAYGAGQPLGAPFFLSEWAVAASQRRRAAVVDCHEGERIDCEKMHRRTVERLGIMPLKVGDLVRLKIGGPAMTIEAVDGKSPVVICTWIAGEVRRRGRFNASILQKVEEKQDKPERSDVLGVSDRSKNASGSDH
jgi:uncharacterized protein YodC (DUF2158 family)